MKVASKQLYKGFATKSEKKREKILNRKKKISCEREKSAKNKIFAESDQVTQFSRHNRGG
jgi:hypothetical protein